MAAISANEQLLQLKADSFVDFHLWPLPSDFDPQGWLRNFAEDELEHATNLLNAFMFFSPLMVDALFVGAFQQISSLILNYNQSYSTGVAQWQRFCRDALVVHVEGEAPNPSDSGYKFARRARQLIGIREDQLVKPLEALEALYAGFEGGVVFVDDFVGSGSQFETTLYRQWQMSDGSMRSLVDYQHGLSVAFYYCPLICTSAGLEAIQLSCPGVNVAPAHVLTEQYNLLSSDCHLWPKHLRATAEQFIRAASRRAGIPDWGTNGWQGFHALGLGLAIEDSVPDATLPIFYWEENGWIPLRRKR